MGEMLEYINRLHFHLLYKTETKKPELVLSHEFILTFLKYPLMWKQDYFNCAEYTSKESSVTVYISYTDSYLWTRVNILYCVLVTVEITNSEHLGRGFFGWGCGGVVNGNGWGNVLLIVSFQLANVLWFQSPQASD